MRIYDFTTGYIKEPPFIDMTNEVDFNNLLERYEDD